MTSQHCAGVKRSEALRRRVATQRIAFWSSQIATDLEWAEEHLAFEHVIDK
jgi:hypothetical protein